MDVSLFAFGIISGLTLALALVTVTAPNFVHSAIALAGSLIGVAALYVLLQAEFVAVVQVVIYVGAVVVLILFALMLTERATGKGVRVINAQWWAAALIGLLVLLILGSVATQVPWRLSNELPPADPIQMMGEAFVGNYLLPFEVVSVILLVALVGALIISRPARQED